MRTLDRNKQKIYFANLIGQADVIDEYGCFTGETTTEYSEPVPVKVNISPARGEASIELFGTDLNYTKTIVMDKDYGLNENSILWVDKDPSEPYNYIVVSVAKSINSVSYAIREVNVNADNQSESI